MLPKFARWGQKKCKALLVSFNPAKPLPLQSAKETYVKMEQNNSLPNQDHILMFPFLSVCLQTVIRPIQQAFVSEDEKELNYLT